MRRFAAILAVLALFTMVLVPAVAQENTAENANSDPNSQVQKDRRYAMELYDQGKILDALPWFEKVATELPDDAVVMERLAMCIYARAKGMMDPEQRKAENVRVRKLMLRAQELGNQSDIVKIALADIPEDGSFAALSDKAEIDSIMQRAEADFSAGRYDAAKDGYLQALLLDPNYYFAALFLGDVYFAKKEYGAAAEWFNRAIRIDPNTETAYRYLADSLMFLGKYGEARQSYIEAVITDPYNQKVWMGLSKFANFANAKLTWYKFKSPNSFEKKAEGQININIDAGSLDKKDGTFAWLMYDMLRAQWQGEKFKTEFPAEKEYRHTLKEEADALSLVATVVEEGKIEEKDLPEDLRALLKLKQAGLIEAYVLFNAADQGIAQDYLSYREKHKDLLLRYLSEIVVPPLPKEKN